VATPGLAHMIIKEIKNIRLGRGRCKRELAERKAFAFIRKGYTPVLETKDHFIIQNAKQIIKIYKV
jgi:hypothetical protein